VRRRVAEELYADGRATGLGGRLMHRPDADVVDERRAVLAARPRRVDLLASMRREADQHVGPHEPAHLRDRHVLLADVDAVGPRLGGHPRTVVDDQERPEALAQHPRGVSDGGELIVGQLLLAQLHDIHSARDRAAQQLGQIAAGGHRAAHQVQPRRRQARPSLGAGVVCRHRPKSATPVRASISRMPPNERPDVLVVGGGAIGLAVAWRARERGMSVTLLERDATGAGTSHVAAGMLAPVAEAEFGEAGRRVLELGLRSAQIWPAFASELEDAAETGVGLIRTGTLLLARDEDGARELERQLAFRESLGLRVQRLRASEARALEPALAPTVRLALLAPDDHSVDPRLVLVALRRACLRAGVRVREHAPVARVELDGERVSGVALEDGERLLAGEVVLAAGPWTAAIAGLPDDARVPVRPVKGQILRLRDPAGAGLLSRVARFEGGYLVPRADGRYVLGATVEERGFDPLPSAGGVYELLRDARELLPGVSELEIEELSVGFRPGTPDNAPVIGRGALAGLTWATGHYRNGILLAPLTAQLLADLLAGAQPVEPAAEAKVEQLRSACAPARFTSPAGERPLVAAAGPVGAA
jgi:glycine oxidase